MFTRKTDFLQFFLLFNTVLSNINYKFLLLRKARQTKVLMVMVDSEVFGYVDFD